MNYLHLPHSTSHPPFAGKIVKWLLPNGSPINRGDPYLLIETEKVINELTSEYSGWLYYSPQLSSELLINHKMAVAAIAEEQLASADETAVLSHLDREIAAGKIPASALFDVTAQPEFPLNDIATKQSVGLAKLFEARQLSLTASQAVYSMVAIHIECEPVATKISHYKNDEKLAISMGELLTYELSRILMRYPSLNGCFLNGETYHYNQLNLGLSINIGGKGLKVVSIGQADQKELKQISAEVKDLSLCYLRDELSEDHFKGITFSISDMSSLGTTDMIPTLNIFQSAILGICAVSKKTNDFKVCLAFDHRVADGTMGMAMLRELKSRLESES